MRNFFRRYYVPEITPMKFHKFYHYVVMPINILVAAYYIYYNYASGTALNDLSTVYNGLLLTSCIVAFAGCFKMRKWGWLAIMFGFALELVWDFAVIIISATVAPSLMLQALLESIWRILFIILFGGYYIKRQPLFFHPVPYSELPKDVRRDYERAQAEKSAGRRI